ncbi:DNA-binding response regulator [Niabella ginsenosidivorans]|uniref:DNA-binding response regulator n=1 Tax=Niabella ginsenosidivorans TaxID=1176587 RepID=A0A1A9I9C1_9BACT|nr:response regulator transcription factor [Niabella ginsenosidivorans]ANH83659.1 DNA-binding response regulator [Niabella ginsenosidivorans]
MSIRVFIYDDNIARRDSLKNLIQFTDEFEYAGEAENCKNAVAEMEDTQPDVVLMDINMPEVNGLEGLKKIKAVNPEIKVLMQTVFDDSDKIFTSIRNGASGYILKTDSSQKLLQAIRDVYNGGAVMNPGIAVKVLDYFKPSVSATTLSDRETEVLNLLANGLSYKMIADKLGVTFNTVSTYTKRIYEKLHVASLGEAISYYYKHLKYD